MDVRGGRHGNGNASPVKRSLHSRRRRPPLVCPERETRLRFRTQESLEEIHYIVHAPPAYHYSLDGFADEEVEENWEAEELTVPELRAALAKRRLPTQGRKMDLVARLGDALRQERTERAEQRSTKRRKLDAILTAQREEMEDRREAASSNFEHDPTSFTFFFNSLENNSPPSPSASTDHDTTQTSSSEKPISAAEDDDFTSTDRGTKRKVLEFDANAATFGVVGDGLVGKLSRFLDQQPPSSPLKVTSPSASPRRPLKGVLKKREVKAPEDMTTQELRELLAAYGVTGASLKQKKAALVPLLKKVMSDSCSATKSKRRT